MLWGQSLTVASRLRSWNRFVGFLALEENRVVIAEILRSRGNKGEVSARSQTDVAGRLEDLKTASVRLADGTDISVEVESSWPHQGHWVFKFAGVDRIEDADRFAGSEVWIAREDRGELQPGEYFQSDLLGCIVIDRISGDVIGPVTGYEHFGASPLLEVQFQGRPVLVPLVEAICPVIDIANRKILAEIPEGLLDL